MIDPVRPPAHVREDRVMREVAYPTTSIPHPIAQINHIAVSPKGQYCPTHVHAKLWETFICLHGYVRLRILRRGRPEVERMTVDLSAGEQVVVSPGDQHDLEAAPNSMYLELRSVKFSDELEHGGQDKMYVDPQDGVWIAQLNQEASLIA